MGLLFFVCLSFLRVTSASLLPQVICYIILSVMSTEDLKGIGHSDPNIMGGTPVFVGTRVPLQNLIDSARSESIEDFLDGFPSVKREQVIAVIEAGKLRMLEAV
jgi:uncharacterized protein (DUF433 family)